MLSAKAAEEAKLEREMEEKAFEDNKRENERMARKRYPLQNNTFYNWLLIQNGVISSQRCKIKREKGER